MAASNASLQSLLQERFSYEGKKLLVSKGVAGLSDTFVAKQLTAELNMLITGPRLVEGRRRL